MPTSLLKILNQVNSLYPWPWGRVWGKNLGGAFRKIIFLMKTRHKEDALPPSTVSLSKSLLLVGRLSNREAKGQKLDEHIPYPEPQMQRWAGERGQKIRKGESEWVIKTGWPEANIESSSMKIRDIGTGVKGQAMNNNGWTAEVGATVCAWVLQVHCSMLDRKAA